MQVFLVMKIRNILVNNELIFILYQQLQ